MSSQAEANSILQYSQYSGDLKIKGRKLKIVYAKKRTKDLSEESSTRLFVGNVAEDTTVKEITEIFSQFGQINNVDLFGKNFCFVEVCMAYRINPCSEAMECQSVCLFVLSYLL